MASRKKLPGSREGRNSVSKVEENHWSGLVSALNHLRGQGALCDVTLVVLGRHIPAHRVVLAAGSPVFQLMFTTKMKEATSQEVEIGGVEPDAIENLVDFIYTARISVNCSNVQQLLQAADQYQVETVKTACVEFLIEQIDAENCLGLAALGALLNCPPLRTRAEAFLRAHFSEVLASDEFLQLDAGRISALLKEERLHVPEEQVYEAALRWLRHDSGRRRHLVELLGCVRFRLLSRGFLSTTVQAEPLIQASPACLSMLICGMRYHLLNGLERRLLGNEVRPLIRPRRKVFAVFKDSGPRSCRYFNPKDCSWSDLGSLPEGRSALAAACCGGVVYVLSAAVATAPAPVAMAPVSHLDAVRLPEGDWTAWLAPPTSRGGVAFCAAGGRVYLSGGADQDGAALDVFESYDPQTDSWRAEPRMAAARCCHGAVAAGGLVYVCGGAAGGGAQGQERILNNFEVFDPKTQEWSVLSPMRQPRKNHGLVVVGNRIFAVGGEGPQGRLRSVEFFVLGGAVWRGAPPLPWVGGAVWGGGAPLPQVGGVARCAAVGQVIYVLAGRELRHVLKLHTQTYRWEVCSNVSAFPSENCVLCVVDL